MNTEEFFIVNLDNGVTDPYSHKKEAFWLFRFEDDAETFIAKFKKIQKDLIKPETGEHYFDEEIVHSFIKEHLPEYFTELEDKIDCKWIMEYFFEIEKVSSFV